MLLLGNAHNHVYLNIYEPGIMKRQYDILCYSNTYQISLSQKLENKLF